MAQHDYDIANADGATVRADINALVEAIASNNSGATAPGTTFAYMWWIDTGNNLVKQRNGTNTDWITRGDLTGLYFGAEPADATILKSGATATLTVGFNATPVKVGGTDGSGNTGTATLTPILASGKRQYATVTGAFTLEDPTTGTDSLWITFTNDSAGPHSVTISADFSADLLPGSTDWNDANAATNEVVMAWDVASNKWRYGIYNNA